MKIPVLVEIRSPLCVCKHSTLIVSQFPANHIAGFAGMQYLVPMHTTIVAPNCFGATASAVALASSASAASLRGGVVVSHRFGEHFVGHR